MWKLAAVAADLRTPPPSFLLDETYRLTLDRAAGQGPVIEAVQDDLGGGAVKLVNGSVSLSSTKATAPVTASAGRCTSRWAPLRRASTRCSAR